MLSKRAGNVDDGLANTLRTTRAETARRRGGLLTDARAYVGLFALAKNRMCRLRRAKKDLRRGCPAWASKVTFPGGGGDVWGKSSLDGAERFVKTSRLGRTFSKYEQQTRDKNNKNTYFRFTIYTTKISSSLDNN